MENRMKTKLLASWRGMHLLVLRSGEEIDRVHADEIRRVILVNQGKEDTPGDLSFALVETDADDLFLPAHSGIAGCIHFEHQSFWAEHNCVYWVNTQQIDLPRKLRSGLWPLTRRTLPDFVRLPRSELAPYIGKWPLEGPQTWEQRKWSRIVRERPLGPLDPGKRKGLSEAAAGQPEEGP